MLRAIAFIAAFLAASPALSCGNPLIWAMLFARMPEAKLVFDADLAAREAGRLQARVFDQPNTGVDYHQWSMAWINDAAQSLNASVVSELEPGEFVTILLADAVAAIRFQPGAEPRVISAVGLNFDEGFEAITTVNALESGLNFGFTATQMVEMGVLVPTEADHEPVLAALF